MFSVVEFTLTKEVEAVPKAWLTKDGSCWWPNYQNGTSILDAVRQCQTPTPDKYQPYPVRVLKHYSTYEVAKSKLKQAENDSDLSSEAEPDGTPMSRFGQGITLRRRQLSMENREEDSDDNEMPPPSNVTASAQVKLRKPQSKRFKSTVGMEEKACPTKLPQLPRVPQAGGGEGISGQIPSHILGLVTPPSAATSSENGTPQITNTAENMPSSSHASNSLRLPGLDPLPSSDSATGNFQAWVVRNMNLMKAQLNQMQESMDVLVRDRISTGPSSTPVSVMDEFDELLPIKNNEQLDMLYEALEKKGNRQILVSKLSSRGGKNVSDRVRRILRPLLSDKFANTFSWIGSRGEKRSFKNSILVEIVYDSVKANSRITDDDKNMEDIIKDWLRNAKKRIEKSESQSGPLNGPADGGNDRVQHDGIQGTQD